MKKNDKSDTLSVCNELKEAGFDEVQANSMTRIFDRHYKNIEDDIMNKFQLANQDNLQAIKGIKDDLTKSIDRLDVDIKSIKGANRWDRITILLGFIAVGAAIFFGLNH